MLIQMKGGTNNVERKYVLGIFALAMVAILGVGMVSALGNGFMEEFAASHRLRRTRDQYGFQLSNHQNSDP